MTEETARFLLDLVNGLQLDVGHSDFDTNVTLVQNARTELQALVPQTEEPPSE